jgi:hypothetical protein
LAAGLITKVFIRVNDREEANGEIQISGFKNMAASH